MAALSAAIDALIPPGAERVGTFEAELRPGRANFIASP